VLDWSGEELKSGIYLFELAAGKSGRYHLAHNSPFVVLQKQNHFVDRVDPDDVDELETGNTFGLLFQLTERDKRVLVGCG
jgi:hypothetical protein